MRTEEKTLRAAVGVVLATGCLLFLSVQAGRQDPEPEWLQPARPTRLDWALLDLQANLKKDALSEEGLAVSFRLGAGSRARGVLYCDIYYSLLTGSAALLEEERRISQLFEGRRQALYPWARLVFERHRVPDKIHMRPTAVPGS